MSQQPFGLYLHIPFCTRRCHYCAFPVTTQITPENQAHYTDTLINHIEYYAHHGGQPSSVYFGGGTPSLLENHLLEKIVEAIHRHWSPTDIEWSIECNPEQVTPEKLSFLWDLGFRRISMGMQAYNNEILKTIGRFHSTDNIDRALNALANSTFQNISCDLILGLPGKRDINSELGKLLEFPFTHISGYFLMIKEGSAFAQFKPELPSEEKSLEEYHLLHETLLSKGFVRYECSNWAKPGFECTHNKHVWENKPFLGLGMGAHSFFQQKRFEQHPTFEKFCTSPAVNISTIPSETSEDLAASFVLLGLRTKWGLSESELQTHLLHLPKKFLSQIETLISDGLLKREKHRITSTETGFLFHSHIVEQLLT